MQKEQRDYLKERLGPVRDWQSDRYRERDKPAEVRHAEATIQRWESAHYKKMARDNSRIKKEYDKVREVVMGEDYDAALQAIRAFEQSHTHGGED
jgi:hypothetical protein